MIDLHCHYLPFVDDGADSLEEALALARAAVANGIRHAALTPHVHPGRYENTLSGLKPRFDAFCRLLDSAHVPLQLHLAGEVRLLPESLTLLDEHEVPMLGTWNDQRVMLLEFPHEQIPPGSLKAVAYLRERGVLPMIAHPERNKHVMNNWRLIEPFVHEGCLLQLTAGSVGGMFGVPAQRTADRLLAAGWVTVMATDAHNLEHRPPVLAQGRRVIEHFYGSDAARLLTEINPAKILGLPYEPLADALPQQQPQDVPQRAESEATGDAERGDAPPPGPSPAQLAAARAGLMPGPRP